MYWANACQIIPPHDAGIAASITANLELWALNPTPDELARGARHPLHTDPLEAVATHYYHRLTRTLCFRGAVANAAAPRAAYTALHGVGTPWVQRAAAEFGLPPPVLTAAQCDPDPDFPTVPFPNPGAWVGGWVGGGLIGWMGMWRTGRGRGNIACVMIMSHARAEEGKGAWALAFEAAEAAGATLALANDPDADRLAAAERDPATGAWRAFTGNEIGAMLAVWVIENHKRRRAQEQREGAGGSGAGGGEERLALLSSTVSSRMLAAIAAEEGVRWEETLTGFKWLGNRALELEAQG